MPSKQKKKTRAEKEHGPPGRGRPPKENILEGLTNLDTGELAVMPSTNFPSMRAAAGALHVDIGILKDARNRGSNAFGGNGAVNRERIIEWLKAHGPKDHNIIQSEATPSPHPEDEFEENYNIPDEAGGVGQTLKSLQAYERKAKRRLDDLEKSTTMHPSIKVERVKAAQDAWLKVVNSLLKYDLAVDMAKRESGELMPLAEAIKGVQALLAWHTVGTSDALRNVIPELEGKNKYEIATLLDPALRSSIYRNFKLGCKLGKIPEWMGRTAADFVTGEPVFSLDVKQVSTNLDDY